MPGTDGHSPPESVSVGHSPPQSDIDGQLYTLDVRQAQALFDAANLPRSLRSITRFCKSQRLDAVTVDGPTGPEWRISEASVQRAIDELKHVFSVGDIASHSRPQPAMSGSQNQDEMTRTSSDIDGHGPTVSDTDRQRTESARYVEQLEKRIEEKDETIEFLQEELTDRRAQISGMKQIIDGQRQLLETINTNVAPVFGALAKLVAPKTRDADDPIVARMMDNAEGSRTSPQ
jgi:hypothetical protein